MIDSQIVVISILKKKICVETETCETCHSKPGFRWISRRGESSKLTDPVGKEMVYLPTTFTILPWDLKGSDGILMGDNNSMANI